MTPARGRTTFLGLASFVLLVGFVSSAEATSIQVNGSTLGCFGSGCSTFGSPMYSGATNDLTFTGDAFNVTTDALGSASGFSLGLFARGNTNVPSSTPPLDFTLQVTFTVPVGIGGNPASFTATITGTSTGGGGPESINFNNAFQTFAYSNANGSGSFEFSVANDLAVHKNGSATIEGAIRNATFTQNAPVPVPPIVTPEPATLLLLGSGLGVAALRRRRARR